MVQQILAQMRAFQETEQEIRLLERQLQSLPEERAVRQQALEEVRARAQSGALAVRECQVGADQQILEVKTREAEIAKLEARLNVTKSNAEYTAIQNQIRASKEQRSAAEDRALALLDQVKELQAAAAEVEQEHRAESRVFEEFLQKVAEETDRLKARVAALRERLAGLERQAEPEAILQYRQLAGFFAVRGGQVLAGVVQGICQACGSRIRPNEEVLLLQGQQLVRCKSCGRIIYLQR